MCVCVEEKTQNHCNCLHYLLSPALTYFLSSASKHPFTLCTDETNVSMVSTLEKIRNTHHWITWHAPGQALSSLRIFRLRSVKGGGGGKGGEEEEGEVRRGREGRVAEGREVEGREVEGREVEGREGRKGGREREREREREKERERERERVASYPGHSYAAWV